MLNKMTRYDFNKRYQSAQEVLQDLQFLLDKHITNSEDSDTELSPTYVTLQAHQDIDLGDDTIDFTGNFSDSTVLGPQR